MICQIAGEVGDGITGRCASLPSTGTEPRTSVATCLTAAVAAHRLARRGDALTADQIAALAQRERAGCNPGMLLCEARELAAHNLDGWL